MRERQLPALMIIQETEHLVIVRPPRTDTVTGEVLQDFEWLYMQGYRPLSCIKVYKDSHIHNTEDAILCEKIVPIKLEQKRDDV